MQKIFCLFSFFVLFFFSFTFAQIEETETYDQWCGLCAVVTSKGEATEEEIGEIRAYLKDDSWKVRKAAADVLGFLRNDEKATLDALEETLDFKIEKQSKDFIWLSVSGEEKTRSAVAFALLRIGDAGKEILRDRVKNANTFKGQLEAVEALRSSGDPKDTVGLAADVERIFKGVEKLFNPDPELNPRSPLVDPAFEQNDPTLDWKLHSLDEGKGQISFATRSRRKGSGSLLLEKTNNGGAVYLRSKHSFKVYGGEKSLIRLYFHTDDAPGYTSLRILFEDKDGNLLTGNATHSSMTQTYIRNSPPGKWIKRLALIEPQEDQEYYVRIILKGDKVKVWLDDIEVPTQNSSMNVAPMNMQTDHLSTNSLEKVPPITLNLSNAEGKVRMLRNKEPIVPVLYLPGSHDTKTSYEDFENMEKMAGVNLQTTRFSLNVKSDPKKYDFSSVFENIEKDVASAPESRFFLSIYVSWPQEWTKQHPDELWLNIDGQRAFGWIDQVKGFTDELPEDGYWWPSPFSEKALSDAQLGIKMFIEELKEKSYFNKFVGCHISGGHDGQFNTFVFKDYSPAALKAFRQWLKEKYGNVEALRRAWNNPEITFENVEIPDFSKRGRNESPLFYNPEINQKFADQAYFQSEQGMRIKEGLAKAFKEAMGRPTIAMAWQMWGGIGLGVERVFFQSKDLDILVAQPTYARRLPGYTGGLRSASMRSYALHNKMLIKELDLRTWLRNLDDEAFTQWVGTAESPEMFKNVYKKEFMESFGQDMGFWMYDISRMHFRDPYIYETIAENIKVYKEYKLNIKEEYTPEVAVIWIDDAMEWTTRKLQDLYGTNLDGYTPYIFGEAGFTYDRLYLKDVLNNPSLREYKMYIFANTYRITDEQREGIEKKLKKNGNVLVWNYGSGYIGSHILSDKYISELTNMEIKSEVVENLPKISIIQNDAVLDNVEGQLGMGMPPAYRIVDTSTVYYLPIDMERFYTQEEDVVPLAKYDDDNTAVALKRMKDWTSVFFGIPGTIDSRVLNNLAKEAGIHTFLDGEMGNVEYNGNILMIHFLKNGEMEIRLPKRASVKDFDTDELLGESTSTFSVEARAGEVKYFILE